MMVPFATGMSFSVSTANDWWKACQMSEVKCFMIVPLDRARRSLRRYSREIAEGVCGTFWSHNASVDIEDVDFQSEYAGSGDDRWPHDDPRWPTNCLRCGYEFVEADHWQHNLERLYQAPDGQVYTEGSAPIGAMNLFTWDGITSSAECLARGGGQHLQVKLPDGCWWDIDGPSSKDHSEGGSGWSREGEPPLVTANPSIQTGKYHGWLRAGILVEC